MAELIKFNVVDFNAKRVIGKEIAHTIAEGAPNPIPGLWQSMFDDGSMDFLCGLESFAGDAGDTVGWMGEFDPETKKFNYIAGVLANEGAEVPEGYAFRDIPDCKMGIAVIKGTHENGDLYNNASNLLGAERNKAGYEYDYSKGGFEMEYYSHERFGVPMSRGEKLLELDFYSPCRKKEQQ